MSITHAPFVGQELHDPPTEEEIPEYNRRTIEQAIWNAAPGITVNCNELPLLRDADGTLRIPCSL